MKPKNLVHLLLLMSLATALYAQTVAEKATETQSLQTVDDQLLAQDQKANKQPPPDYVQYDQPPEVVKQVAPKYPAEALKDKIEGSVWTEIWVDERGSVVDVKVSKSENAVFNQAAIDAAKQWVFKPALAKEKPVAVKISVPFRFKLSEGKGVAPSKGVPKKSPEKDPGTTKSLDAAPEVIKMVQAKYPEEASKKGLEGSVWLRVDVDESGKPTSVSVIKSDSKVFDQAAIDAAEQWVFKPAMKDGKAVSTTVTLPFKFKLAEGKKEK
jgi:TonB family protein